MAVDLYIPEPEVDSIVLQTVTTSANPPMMRYDAILVFMVLPSYE
jgi:hypothetical protein